MSCVQKDPGQGEASLGFCPSSVANSSLVISSPWKSGSLSTKGKTWKLMSVFCKTQVLSHGHGTICLNLGPPAKHALKKGFGDRWINQELTLRAQ